MIQIDRDMPKNCRCCPVEHLSIDFFCAITGYITNDVRFNERHPECPLIEIPDNNVGNIEKAFAKTNERCGGSTKITDIVMKRYNAIRKVAGMDEIEEIKEPEGE